MARSPVYLDYQSTTPLDPRVLEAMLPFLKDRFGNAGSRTHAFGHDAQDAVEEARAVIAEAIGAEPREIVFTSGATESNNLALRGICERPRLRGQHLVSEAAEHKAVLDPLAQLARCGFQVTLVPTEQAGSAAAGMVDPDRFAKALRDDTLLASVMLANNEIGVIQSVAEIARRCRERGVVFHTDATQAVGKIAVDVRELDCDLLSFSAHKICGPKGIGALYVRKHAPAVRLEPMITGGGQEGGLRSGTLNVPGIVGFAKAIEICVAEREEEAIRIAALRDRLWRGLCENISDLQLNGPSLDRPALRLAGNLNLAFSGVAGEALMLRVPELAMSSGSACTSAQPEPSHVLKALGLSDDEIRCSLRFGLGRFTTAEEIDFAIERISVAVKELRSLSEKA